VTEQIPKYVIKNYTVTTESKVGAMGGYSGMLTIPSNDITDDVIAIIPLGGIQSGDSGRVCALAPNTYSSMKSQIWRANAGNAATYNCALLFIYT
jgi:hypothetical protein